MTDPKWTTIEPGEYALDCIVCDKALRNDGGHATNQPAYGLAWTTHGHWPSSLFDSMGRGFLEISICDDCMIAKASKQIAFVPPTERDVVNELMTVGTVRSYLSEHADDVTFKELVFRNGAITSCGLPLFSPEHLEAMLKSMERDRGDEDDGESCSS